MAKETMTPQQIADKQARNVSANVESFRRGVQNPERNPMELAAANVDKAVERYRQAADKMKRGLLGTSIDDWKTATLAKSDRLASGVEAAKPKIAKFHEQRQQFQSSINSELDKMPTKTLEDNIARMTMQVRKMSGFQFKK